MVDIIKLATSDGTRSDPIRGYGVQAMSSREDERRVVRALAASRAPLRAVVVRETSPHPPMLRSSAGHVNRSQARPQNHDLLPPSAS